MHSYLHNIKTFNNATRHLTRVERALYRDAIELYYDTEQPLPAVDFDRLARRLMANTEEEIAALEYILGEFFERTGDVYTHHYCDEVIEAYHNATTAKSIAGKASAAARKKKAEERRAARKGQKEQKATAVEQPLSTPSTAVANHEPETMNHEPVKTSCSEPPGSPPAAPPEIVYSLPTNKHTTDGELFHITEAMFNKLCDLYPAVDVMQALRSMDGWALSNPSKRKTLGGMPKFINSWLAKDQNQGGNRGKTQPSAHSGQYPPRAPTPAERVAAKRAAAGSPDVGAVVPDVGNVRPYLVKGPGG